MMLLILSADPLEAAKLVPKKIRNKQLLELMQMISCVVDFGYKCLPSAPAMKEWIARNAGWVHIYASYLLRSMKSPDPETRIKYKCLLDLLRLKDSRTLIPNITTAVFRYAKEYKENTQYKTNTELPVDEVIEEYKKYAEWKGKKWR